MPYITGSYSKANLYPFSPLLNETVVEWLARLGPVNYSTIYPIIYPDTDPGPTHVWSFLYYEQHGPDNWGPAQVRQFTNPITSDTLLANPGNYFDFTRDPLILRRPEPVPGITMPTPTIPPGTPLQTPVSSVVEDIQAAMATGADVREGALLDRLRTPTTDPPVAPPTPPPIPVAAPKFEIKGWMYAVGAIGLLFFLMKD